MRNLLAILLLSLCSLPIYGQGFVEVVRASGSSPVAAEDWTSSFVVVYDFEASGDPWANHTNASGGSACDATISGGTPTRETGAGFFVEKTAGVFNEDSGAEGDRLTVSCAGYQLDSQDITMGGWFHDEDDQWSIFWGRAVSNTGTHIKRESSGNVVRWQLGTGAGVGTHDTVGNSWPSGEWLHISCWYDATADEMDCLINAATDGVAATGSVTDVDDRTDGYIMETLGAGDKRADEIYKYAGLLTAAETARIAACGIDGSACTCNGASWVTYGRTDESCTASGTPWSCCSGSGTGCVDQDLLTDDCNKASP